MQTEKQKVGEIGENIAVKHLVKHKYKILDRNYRKKWGEIDIIAKKNNVFHFIEVKSVSCETWKYNKINVSGETFDDYRPEENVHPWKIKRLKRAIQSYLIEKNVSGETEWQLDIMAVFIDFSKKRAKIRITEDIGL